MKISGACLCATITYRIDGPLTDASLCHCSICRKLTGSAFGAYATVEKRHFDWAHADIAVNFYAPTKDTKRYFCPRCGSFMATEHQLEPQHIFISLGTLEHSGRVNALTLEYQQFAASKAPWHCLQNNLKSFTGWPGD